MLKQSGINGGTKMDDSGIEKPGIAGLEATEQHITLSKPWPYLDGAFFKAVDRSTLV